MGRKPLESSDGKFLVYAKPDGDNYDVMGIRSGSAERLLFTAVDSEGFRILRLHTGLRLFRASCSVLRPSASRAIVICTILTSRFGPLVAAAR